MLKSILAFMAILSVGAQPAESCQTQIPCSPVAVIPKNRGRKVKVTVYKLENAYVTTSALRASVQPPFTLRSGSDRLI